MELEGAGLQEAEGSRVGVAARVDRQLEVIIGIVGWRVGGEAADRPVLEALIDREDHELPGARQRPGVHELIEVAHDARIVGAVPTQDLLDAIAHHGLGPHRKGTRTMPHRPTFAQGSKSSVEPQQNLVDGRSRFVARAATGGLHSAGHLRISLASRGRPEVVLEHRNLPTSRRAWGRGTREGQIPRMRNSNRSPRRQPLQHLAIPVAVLGCVAALGLAGRAQAQDSSGFGLDLTDDNKKPDDAKKPAAPADTPPATDATPPADQDASKPVAKQGLDVGEHDVSLEDRVKSVQRKTFDKKNHFELEPHFGVSVNDGFYQKYIPGGQAAFHFSDSVALAARFDYDVVVTTDDVSTAKRELHSTLFVSKPKFGVAGDFMWTPALGKASLFNSIIQFDSFVLAGAGAMVTQTSSNPDSTNPLLNQGPHPAFDLGCGQRFGLNDFLAIEWQLIRDPLRRYAGRAGGEPDSEPGHPQSGVGVLHSSHSQ